MWPKCSNKEHYSNEDECPNVTSLQPLPRQCRPFWRSERRWVLSRQHKQISKMFTSGNDSQRKWTGISTQGRSRPGTSFHHRMMGSVGSRAGTSLALHQQPQYQTFHCLQRADCGQQGTSYAERRGPGGRMLSSAHNNHYGPHQSC